MSSNNLLILVATMTGTALMAAEDIAEYCENNEINTKVHELINGIKEIKIMNLFKPTLKSDCLNSPFIKLTIISVIVAKNIE